MAQRCEPILHTRLQCQPAIGQLYRAVEPAKNRAAKMLLKGFDLKAQSGWRDAQFVRCAGERQVPGGGLKGAQSCERGEAIAHVT